MVTYSNFRYEGRVIIEERMFTTDYQLNATVDVTVKKCFRKPVVNKVPIAKCNTYWMFVDSGEFVPREVENLAKSYELTNRVKLETYVVE